MAKARLEPEDELSLDGKEKHNHKQNMIRYGAVLLTCLIYAYFFGGYFPYTLLYITLALPVMSLAHLVVICFLFRMSERLNERTFIKGEFAYYHLILQNSSFFYMPYITVRMHLEGQIICKNLKSMRLALAPFSTREFKYQMPLLFRGRYEIGVKSVRISDLLGLFSYTFHPLETKSILVEPRIVDIQNRVVPVTRISEGEITSGCKEAGNDELVNIREYVYGDSFRKIHWKLSSKLGKTMVKETRNELDNDVVMIMNLRNPDQLNEDSLIQEDCLIEEMISQISNLIKQNVYVRLCFYKDGPKSLKASNSIEFHDIYMLLSEVKFNQNYPFNEAIDYFTNTEQNNQLVCLFTVVLDEAIISKAFHIKNKGFDPELYYIKLQGAQEHNGPAYQDLEEMMAKNNIRIHRLEPSFIQIESAHHEVGAKTAKVGLKAYEG